MKKKIMAFTLAISTIFMCCAFTTSGIGFEEEIPEVVEELANVNVNMMTPMDAMNALFTLQKKAQEVMANGLD